MKGKENKNTQKLTQVLKGLKVGDKIIFPNREYTRVAISRIHKRNVMARYKTSTQGLYNGVIVERVK